MTGCFTASGGWFAAGTMNGLTRYVDGLVRLRRTTSETPAEVAERIRSGPHALVFDPYILEHWSSLERFEDWRSASVSSSIEACVKYAGYGNQFEWLDDGGIRSTTPKGV